MLIQSVARPSSIIYQFDEEGGGVHVSIGVTGQGGGQVYAIQPRCQLG